VTCPWVKKATRAEKASSVMSQFIMGRRCASTSPGSCETGRGARRPAQWIPSASFTAFSKAVSLNGFNRHSTPPSSSIRGRTDSSR